MDKKLLDGLDNLSEALAMIVEALERKNEKSNSATTNALVSGDFTTQIKEINISIKSIKEDTKKILENQQTILEMSKKKDKKSSLIEDVGGDEKVEGNLKKGVTTILLIAAGVLAIGLAFKLVGNIDFLSVVGLSLAIVLVSIAFEKIAKMDIPIKTAIDTSLVMTIMAFGITMSSFVLSFITPISFGQAASAILIAGMFSVISFGISKLIRALGKSGMTELGKSILFLPLILPAIALAIAVSSWVLKMITPISFPQAITGILIAGMFTVISYGISKLVGAFKDMKEGEIMAAVIGLPLLLPAMALAIAVSSWFLKMIVPISFGQAITAILISAVYVVLSYGMEKIAKTISKMDWKDIPKIPVFFTLMALAISASAAIFSTYSKEINEITFTMLLKVLIIGAAMGIVMVIVGVAMRMIGKLSTEDVIKVPIMFTLLALSVALSAAIFYNFREEIDGITFTSMFKILVFSVCLAISVAVLAAGMAIVNALGDTTSYLKGGIAILIIAATIMVASQILSLGDYTKYPDWKWSLGVGLSLIAFGTAAVVLGTIAMSGIGALAILAGGAAILVVAATIVATSYILGKGKYDKYPNLDWSLGVGLSMTGFGMAMGLLGTFILGSLGLGMVALMAGKEAVLMIAETIVESSFILQKGKYSGGPTKDWSEGIALALGAFAPVYKMLSSGGIMKVLFGSGPTPTQFSEGILTVSRGIVDAANYFAGTKVAFSGGPSKKWAEGVGTAIAAFAPVYTALSSGGFFSNRVSPDDMKEGILTISDGIIAAARRFSSVKSDIWNSYPKKEWITSIKSLVGSFLSIVKSLKDTDWIELDSVNSVARRLVTTANILNKGNFTKKIDPSFIKNLSSNIIGFAKLGEKLTEINEGSGLLKTAFGLDPVSRTANSMVKLASAYDKMSNALRRFGGALASIDAQKVDVIRRLTGNMAVLAAMNEQAFNSMMNTLENKGSVFAQLLDADKTKTNGPVVGEGKGKKGGIVENIKPKGKYGETHQQLDIMIDLLNNINRNTSSLDDFLAKQGFRADPLIDLTMKK